MRSYRKMTGRIALIFGGLMLLMLSGCSRSTGYLMNQSGTAYFERGQYAFARGDFERAVADQPDNADYIHNLAAAKKKQGDLAGAEQAYRRALWVDPSHQPSYHSLAQLYVEQNRDGEALALVQEWTDIEPFSAEPHVETAWLQREMGNPAAAEQALQQALRVDPKHPKALAHLGQVYQDSGQSERAALLYQQSLAQRWYQPEVQSRLVTLQGNGNYPVNGGTTTTAYGPNYGTGTAYNASPWLPPAPAMATAPGYPTTSYQMQPYAAQPYPTMVYSTQPQPTMAYQGTVYPTTAYPTMAPTYATAPQPVQLGTPIYNNPQPTVISGVPVVQPY
ncbi:MAG: tetratricopeptide repeat protein [Planctomycetaceae bacterium]